MRRSMAAALVLTVLLFGGAYLAAGKTPAQEMVPDGAAQEQSPQGQRDSGVELAVQDGDAVETMALDVYLQGVVRGEMPASFEQEALKAQAAAERTYVYYQLAAGRKEAHPQADVCTDPACCNAWLSEEAARDGETPLSCRARLHGRGRADETAPSSDRTTCTGLRRWRARCPRRPAWR